MTERRILAFTGRPGVGKSTAADLTSDIQEVPVVRMGDEVRNRRDRNLTNGSEGVLSDGLRSTSTWEMAQLFREEYGSHGVALACVSRIATGFLENDIVIVDGVRSVTEANFFKTALDCPVHLVAVTADHETRLDRFAERHARTTFVPSEFSEEALRVAAEYEMDKRTWREEAAGLADAIETASYEVENSGTEDELEQQCARLLDDIAPDH